MKNVICILSLLLISTFSWSQSGQETIATFVIREAALNNEDITPIALDASQYLVFYTIENEKETYLANVCNSNDNQVFTIKKIQQLKQQMSIFQKFISQMVKHL